MSYEYEEVDERNGRTYVEIAFDEGRTVRDSVSNDAVDEQGLDGAVADAVQTLTEGNDALPNVDEEPETQERTAEVSTEESETDADEESDDDGEEADEDESDGDSEETGEDSEEADDES